VQINSNLLWFLTISEGILRQKAFPRVGNLNFAWVGWRFQPQMSRVKLIYFAGLVGLRLGLTPHRPPLTGSQIDHNFPWSTNK